MDAVRTKLQEIQDQYDAINALLLDEEVLKDPAKLTKLSKEQARLKQSVDAWQRLQELDERIAQADEMLRYIEENQKRDKALNPNEWWTIFDDAVSKFNFAFSLVGNCLILSVRQFKLKR